MSRPRGTPRTRSLGRAADVLRAAAGRPEGASASELARLSGLPRSTVARTLRTLADAGLVEEATTGGWVLGYELVRLARAADPFRRLVDTARPAVGRLRDATGESASLGVPRGRPGLEIVLQLDPKRQVGVANWVGAEVPLHASSAGKLVLAELHGRELDSWLASAALDRFTASTLTDPDALREEAARVRRRGWAEIVDELEQGHAAVSVPVRDAAHELTAMVGVSGPTFRLGRSRRREVLDAVRAAADEIERALASG